MITKVAADTYQPDDYLYAIWEPVVDFNLSAVCRGVQMTLPTTTTDGVTLTGSWTASAGTVSGDSYTPPDSGDAILTFTLSIRESFQADTSTADGSLFPAFAMAARTAVTAFVTSGSATSPGRPLTGTGKQEISI